MPLLSTNCFLEIIILGDKPQADEEADVTPPEEKAGEDPPSPEAPDASDTQGMP